MDVEMERPLPATAVAAAQAQGVRANPVVERKLAELDACLADAMSSRPRRSDVDGSLFAEIQAKTDFLKTLIAAEGECHGGALPEHLEEAKARFAVLKAAFDQWARRDDAAAPAEEEQLDEAAGSGSGCSCTESCFGVEVTGGQEATSDVEREAVEVTTLGATFNAELRAGHKPAATTRSAARRGGWRRSAACCGAAGAVAMAALAIGVAIEFASVARQNVYVVPT